MPRPKTDRRERQARDATTAVTITDAEGHGTPSQTPAPSAITPAEVTTANVIREFEDARQLALDKGQAAAAVAATMAKARLAGLLKDKPERHPVPPAKFDGNYTEAARRIAFLLRLASKETQTDGSGDGHS